MPHGSAAVDHPPHLSQRRPRRQRALARFGNSPWQRRALELAVGLLLVGGGWLLVSAIMELEWTEIFHSLRSYRAGTVVAACCFALGGYAVASTYDLLCRHYEGHGVSTPRALATGFVSLAFSMNLGSLVGGWGMRYRLYSRFGLPVRQTTRIICMALLTNWSGFVLLAGLLFTFHPPRLPADWPMHGHAMITGMGVALLVCCAVYLFMCAGGKGRAWTIRGVKLRRPSLRFACAQLALSSLSWIAMASVLNHLLPPEIRFLHVMAILCVSSITGLIVRVPAGLGVLETVFLAMLKGQAGTSSIVAALLAFRAAYYLLPLLVALLIYAVLEWQARHQPHNAQPPEQVGV